MNRCLLCAMLALFLLSGCDPTGIPDCDDDEDLRWFPCGSQEPDTCGEWRCAPKGEAV